MKKFFIIAVLVIAGGIFACNQMNKGGSSSGAPGIYNSFCSSSSSNGPCSIIPIDINETFGVGYDSFLDSLHQPPFDVFSWQTFIALNWPADSAGKPIGSSITGSPAAPRVWEHYQDPAEVFGTNTGGLNFKLGEAKKSGQKFLYLDSKSPRLLFTGKSVDAAKLNGFQEADGHPLIDRNLNFALYEIKMNPIESKFVIDSNLTNTEGIYNMGIKHSNAINLPASDSATNNVGSMEVKATWRILIPGEGDDTTRYFCRKATIFIDSLHTRNHQPLLIKNVTVGLVGMHIIRKTKKMNSREVWSTFEHVDNTPDNPQDAQAGKQVWSFYNPLCLNCTPNAAPDTLAGDHGQYIWEVKPPYAIKYATKAPGQQFTQMFGTQAVRTYPIYKYTEMINKLWQEQLKGSVWANYRLIGSQWQLSEVFPSPMAPNFLANTTLETFIQPNASCISCHSFATIKYNNTTISTNLSFIFPVYAKVSNLKSAPAVVKKK
ncbi:MAG TPA: hypothetical protein VIM55_15415 [Mucilaginibacter sp.]